MKRKILVADLLCGAGGSSTGCQRALADLGLKMELVCVNHWPTAIETHKKNHPDARHYVQDIATVRPHLLVPEGYLDLLMASPTCTHHSVARGGKPTSDQQRSDPWHIITWLTELRVKRIIIENVWEFTGWGPVDARIGKPIAARKGEYFRAWIDTLRRLGFDPEWRKLNAADFGDATTRQRFILMARSDKRTVSWPVPTHRRKPEGELALMPMVKPWRPARDIIDWSIKGKSIFNRKKALAPKTLARIHAGAVKFGWPEPFLVILRNHMAGQSVDGPLPTIAAGGTHIGLAEPVIVRTNMHGRKSPGARSSQDPLMTITTDGGIGFAEPFVLSSQNSGAPRSAEEPLPTITTGGAGVEERPGCARPMLVEPFILNRHGDNGSTRAHATSEPLPTSDCRGAGYVIEPFILSRQGEGAPRSVDQPTPTQTAKHSHVLVAPYYGTGSGETCHSAEEPLPTVTSKGRFGMVVPITHAGGEDRARDVADTLPTITTAHRGELAFIAAQFGERDGQAPRVHSIEEPSPAICATGHVNLIEATEQYDILFRMLEPHELAAAMGFNSDEAAYEFAGTKTEQIKQIGNAVSVATMKACVGAIIGDAAVKRAKPSKSAERRRETRAA
jgi:DNA (cytosine-5)-methyltransferase 1